MRQLIKSKSLYYLQILLMLVCCNAVAQERTITGKVIDAKTKLPLSSCSIYSVRSGNGVISDEDGNYTISISDRTDSIAISMVGYSAIKKPVSKEKSQIINFEAATNSGSMTEVSVSAKSKYTRAQRLVRLVIKNKSRHDIYENSNFQSSVYDKIELDIKNISEKIQNNRLLKPLRFILNNMDSTADNQKYLPVYLSETIADFYYNKKPQKERYNYTAIKSSGLDNQSLLAYIDGLYKKVNVYDNLIKLVDINFISPIADNALNFYNYHINDTMFIDGHQCIQVQFSQTQYGTNTFNGFMWIVDSTYAIKSMTMHMDKSASINFVNKFDITQNFELNDEKFLPSKNIIFIDLNVPAMKKLGVIAKKTTSFKNFSFNNASIDTVFAKKINDISSVGISKFDTSYWNENRFDPLNKTEKSVYVLMDTLNKIPAIVAYGKVIDVLSSGYYNLGKIDFGDLNNTYNSDRIQGDRFTAGFKTNSTLSEKYRVRGFLGYSTKDQKFRYSLGTLFVLDRKQWSTLNIKYRNDIISSYNNDDDFDQNSIFASFVRRIKPNEIRLVNNAEANINYNKFFSNGFGINIQARSSTLTPYFNIYYTHDNFVPYIITKAEYNNYKTNEIAFTLRYVYKEKFITEHFRRGSLGSNYPIVNLTYTRGLKINSGYIQSDFDYNKLDINLQHDFSDGRFGQLSYTIQAGITKGVLPFLLLNVQKGNDTYYYNYYAFNNMNRYEFIADKYASLLVEQNFGSFPFNHIPAIKKFKWRSLATFKSVIGNMTEENKIANGFYDNTIDYHFTIPNRVPYMEAGVGIENIFRILRLDAVWRLNYLNKNVPTFGILGSIQFKF